MEIFAERLRELRTEKGLSMKQLAKEIKQQMQPSQIGKTT